jgi:hypothetical protein
LLSKMLNTYASLSNNTSIYTKSYC